MHKYIDIADDDGNDCKAKLTVNGSDVEIELPFHDGVADRYFGKIVDGYHVTWTCDEPDVSLWDIVESHLKDSLQW